MLSPADSNHSSSTGEAVSSSGTNLTPCPNDCSGHGACVNRTAGYVCDCLIGYYNADCSGKAQDLQQPYEGWGTIVWGILGAVVGLVLLDKCWTACKKVGAPPHHHTTATPPHRACTPSDAWAIGRDRRSNSLVCRVMPCDAARGQAYTRRQQLAGGAPDRSEFAPVSVMGGGDDGALAGGATEMGEFTDTTGAPVAHAGVVGARADNDQL